LMGICLHKQNRIESDKWAALGTIHFLATVLLITAIVWLVPQDRSATASSGQAMTVEEKYSGLATGVLKSAELKEMPAGIVLKTENLEIRESQLRQKMAGAEPKIREQLEKNLFFLLEQEATIKILVYAARNSGLVTGDISDSEVIKNHLDRITQQTSVSEAEVKDFYKTHKEMVAGMPFEQIKDSIHAYLIQQKKATAVDTYITGLGERNTIQVNQTWARAQYHKAQDNPVDRARMSSKPSMIEFGATGCIPCDMMQPILENLRKSFKDRLNVVFVHVREEQILGARFGIRSIPVQVFFDENGQEVFRHEGFFAEKEVRNQLTRMGVN
jgi:thiol-disulfide isomerase/thioredoxin